MVASNTRLRADITDNLYARTGKLPVWRTIVSTYAIVFRRQTDWVSPAGSSSASK